MSYAIVIPEEGSHEVLTRREQPKPTPGAGEILIRNHAAAVNFIDTIIRRGELPTGMMPELPLVPGVEGAGVGGFAAGDRVAWHRLGGIQHV